ncbi:MAG TPA: type IV pilus assembly protein PilM, partial [Pseudobdellovibrionaceae bacterium]|nr:type IV pilus assembly protein PilM [Pseudobdellovibrionaceae bacterium]
ELGSKRKSVCTGMWGMAVIVKKITMPKMDKKLLAEQIRYEAEQYIPFDINNVSLSHHVLASTVTGETQDILLIAAQNELVSQYFQVVSMANLECKILDVSGFALANCFEVNYGRFPGETIGLLNFGAAVTNFVVISNGDIIFSRDIPVGGQNYTNEISKGMGVSIQEAEMLKLSAVSRQEVPDDVVSLISVTNETIAEEIRNSFDFLSATTNGLAINRCMITGGSAGTTGLMDAVSRVTNLSYENFNPFLRIKVNAKRVPPEYMSQIAPLASVAMGLGMRQVGDS